MSRIICIVQSRVGSSRLPGKALKALAGRPMLAHVLERARAIPGIDDVVLATTLESGDDPLVALALAQQVPVVRGSTWDVLDRFRLAAMRYEADVIVRVTGDCPFLDPAIARLVIDSYLDNPLRAAFVSNDTTMSGFPDGTDVEVFSMDSLITASMQAISRGDREHVTAWMRRTLMTGTVMADEQATSAAQWKLSVDTLPDYLFARAVAQRLVLGDYRLEHTIQVAKDVSHAL